MPTIREQLTAQEANRSRYIQRLEICHNLIVKADFKNEFLIRCQRLEDTFQGFEESTIAIEQLNARLPQDQASFKVETLEVCRKFEDLYFKIKTHWARLEEDRASSDLLNVSRGEGNNVPKAKLPTISIPQFSGSDITQFQSWKSLYDELVHNSNQLSDIQKFSYLRSYVTGQASSTIEAVSFTAASYPLAYKTLCERYLNKRLLASNHLNKLLQFSSLPKDSVQGLRSFLDNFYLPVEAMRSLFIPNLGEFILLQLALRALDPKTALEFETENVNISFPTFDELVNHVKNKCAILEVSANSSGVSANSSSQNSNSNKTNFSSQNGNKNKIQKSLLTNVEPSGSKPIKSDHKKKSVYFCDYCQSKDHKITHCEKFLGLDSHVRYSIAREKRLCFSCLHSSHSRPDCKSTYRCRTCGSSNHHSLLHPNKEMPKSGDSSGTQPPPVETKTSLSGVVQPVATNQSYTVLLGTAVVRVMDYSKQWHHIRCVIDPGSQISAMSESLAQFLKLPRHRSTIQVSGIGSTSSFKTNGEVMCTILPHSNENSGLMNVQSVILPRIASDLPTQIPSDVMDKFKHLQLADTTYYSKTLQSSSIDLLIGAEHYSNIILSSLPIIQGAPSAVPSVFGWLLMGRVDLSEESNQPSKCTSLFISQADPVATQLSKFWEMEEISSVPPQNPEDIQCETHFQQTTSRDVTGRYIVRLPFKNPEICELGSNRSIAEKRFTSLERKLNKNVAMRDLYNENLQSYLDCDHMEVAKSTSDYLLVHHGVYKETSSTTKLRVVFDPNIPSSSGKSLADLLLVGPKLQADIGDLLIKFRLNVIALTGDIQAMYRSILLHPADRKYQHILWRPRVVDDVQEFEVKSVMFGLPPSPYQAQRVLRQLSIDEGTKFPLAAKVIDESIYVDDVLSGGDTIEEVISLKQQLIDLLKAGGFHVRKWASSQPEVLKGVPEADLEKLNLFGDQELMKVLGTQWNPANDSFCYNVVSYDDDVTKRKVLSRIATIYDVNGLLAPIVIWLKIFMQQLWLDQKVTWDSPLSKQLQDKWKTFNCEMSLIRDLSVPRYISTANYKSASLVGFADASGSAMAAVVYLRVVTQCDEIKVHLLRAKTKVAPLKVQTINRLELCAAQLLAKVIHSLSFLTEKLKIDNTYLFSDSSTVLAWLRTQPFLLKIFIANRVSNILELTEPSQWRHVCSEDNAADPASRGLLPSEFISSKIWFSGPSFILNDPSEWPEPVVPSVSEIPELKSKVSTALIAHQKSESDLNSVIEKYSSLFKLEKIMALVLRFVYNMKNNKVNRRHGPVTVVEMQDARLKCINITQQKYFHEDIQAISKSVPCSSRLKPLTPFLDERGILVVGGRLSNSPLSDSAKHPILIPNKSHLAVLLINQYHSSTIHGGPKLVQALLQRHYWITGARSLIRQVLFKCMSCFQSSPKFKQPLMADIPVSRFQQGRPFLICGTDFAGPFSLKTGPRRNSPIVKCYFCIFVCMSTKCIHIELVSSLSTPAFLAALDRFVGRRGLPQTIWSDNGTNFRGAASVLKEIQLFLKNSEVDITNHLLKSEVTWKFIPPSAPNFGGLWEAGVKSVKVHLKHLLSVHVFNFEELTTILIRIESILNSRPLCSLSSSPTDGVDYLSPGHFLIGAPLLSRPEQDVSMEPITHLRRWQMLSHITQCFWRRWKSEYIHTLIQRPKNSTSCSNIKSGDLVLIHGSNTPSQQWPLGRVMECLPGPDKIVRVVKVKTINGDIIRPVSKLAILPIQ